ncbi:WH2 domain-containing protein family protein [Loa loa]|nr:WH2 domain-containing protein family protein [Loa loa]EJD75674.1 WH2 domain-containing protein family protein [Loa loa]
MYLARPVQMGQHNLARNTSKSRAPPPPPIAPPPPELPQKLKEKSKPAPQLVAVKPIFDRDKLLDEVRCGVQLRHTLTNDKSAPTGVGRVRSGGYSPPPDSVASTSAYNNRPDAKKPVFYGKNIENTNVPPVPLAPPPPKAPPPAALLKLGGSAKFDRDKLLNEIHGGVQLRKTVTNDRSAPIGVGIVRNDLSRTASPVPETFALSNSTTNLAATSVPPPPVPPSPSPDFLSSHVQQNKTTKPITNPALLKLGGKQPIDRDALLASIRGGVKLRKVETNDRSSPFPVSRDTSPDRHTPVEPAMAPPPPPLLVPPPPPIPSAEPLRRSRSPKPALMKLGGKVTVDRDELLRSIRQGVKLRKTITNDKSSAIINDDDSGVRSPGRSSPSTSNYEDDVYGSQSLSDLSSIGTSRFSSLSNIPPERSNDLFFASPVVPEAGIRIGATSNSSHTSSPTKSPLNRLPMINVSVDVENYDDDDVSEEYEPETVTLQLSRKQKADECYSSPIPTRKQIEAEIPAGSARDRIKMFGGTEREESHSPVRNLSKSRKLDGEVNNSESSISRMRKFFGDTAVEQSPTSAPAKHTKEQEQAAAATAESESSIRRMVRKFSTDDESNKASQPIWYQKKEEKVIEEGKKTPLAKQKTSGTKDSVKKKSSTKGSKLRRKSSAKSEQQIAISRKTYAAPTKPEEVVSKLSHEIEDETEEQNNHLIRAVPKVDISKFKERFENPPETCLTTEETVKPGRIKKPPWIKDNESQPPPLLSIACKTEEAPRPSWKRITESDEVKDSLRKTDMKPSHKQNSSDHEGSAKPLHALTSTKSGSTGTTKKAVSGFKKNDKVSPVSSSSPIKSSKKDMVNVPVVVEEETTIPTREGVGPYRYTRKTSAADKKPATKKNSISSKETSTSNNGNLLNAISKPFGTNLSTTGQTTTIGADDMKDESKITPTSRHFVWKNKVQSKVSTDRERDEAFGDRTTTSANSKTTTV